MGHQCGGPRRSHELNGILVVARPTVAHADGGVWAWRSCRRGPYEYLLFRGGVTPGNENNWYLRNTAGSDAAGTARSPIPVPPAPEPPDPPGPSPPLPPAPAAARLRPSRFFRPEAVVYAGLPALARFIGLETLGTFHERQGEQSLLTKNGALPDALGPGLRLEAPSSTAAGRCRPNSTAISSASRPAWMSAPRSPGRASRPFRPVRRSC